MPLPASFRLSSYEFIYKRINLIRSYNRYLLPLIILIINPAFDIASHFAVLIYLMIDL